MFVFADDTTLAKTYRSLIEAESCLNNDLKTISHWATNWVVKFNFEKSRPTTKFLIEN